MSLWWLRMRSSSVMCFGWIPNAMQDQLVWWERASVPASLWDSREISSNHIPITLSPQFSCGKCTNSGSARVDVVYKYSTKCSTPIQSKFRALPSRRDPIVWKWIFKFVIYLVRVRLKKQSLFQGLYPPSSCTSYEQRRCSSDLIQKRVSRERLIASMDPGSKFDPVSQTLNDRTLFLFDRPSYLQRCINWEVRSPPPIKRINTKVFSSVFMASL